MNNTNKEKLFKLSTLAFCLAALPQAVHAAEEVQQVELKQVNVVGKNRSLRTENRNDYTTSAETFAKFLFPQQPKPKHRFSAVFVSNIH